MTEVPEAMAAALNALIGPEVKQMIATAYRFVCDEPSKILPAQDVAIREEHLRDEIVSNPSITDTDRTAIVLARRGQGLFRQRVGLIETRCRITGVSNPEHLRASHCKPWRDSSNEERLDGENGLLLTPSIDHLFDRGFISFEDKGKLIVSPVAHKRSLERLGVRTQEVVAVGAFTDGQKKYLEHHRERIFLQARRR